ncbi:universal stress protein [Mycolicibacterium sp.]|uniref:universal stress protein n=1 Tax=Mycolicibacterium sp. TaxID=2320850 RepID=UPI0028AD25D3|nr:universal stress protein [Mycolicibacterium sp.]
MTGERITPRRILVATDFSVPAGAAIARAGQLAAQHGARLSLLHVLPDDLDVDQDRVRAALSEHALRFAAAAPADVAVRRGTVAAEIVAEAVASQAGLVVVGAHGGDWLADLFLGSTAENVVRQSTVPVLMVKRPPAGAYRSVILSVDDSAASVAAARFGGQLAPGAEHFAVHVCTVVGETLLRVYGASEEQINQLRRISTAEVHDEIDMLAATIDPPPKEVIIAPGHPPTKLVEQCDSLGADLIVTGTGARSPAAYALLGSVAQHVMHQAHCDVLIVPAAR